MPRKVSGSIGLIGAEPQRAAVISFTAAYCEIEATYLVAGGFSDPQCRRGRPNREA